MRGVVVGRKLAFVLSGELAAGSNTYSSSCVHAHAAALGGFLRKQRERMVKGDGTPVRKKQTTTHRSFSYVCSRSTKAVKGEGGDNLLLQGLQPLYRGCLRTPILFFRGRSKSEGEECM